MAENITAVSYKLKAVTLNGVPFEIYSAVYGGRTAVLFNEAPAILSHNFRAKVVTAAEVPFEIYSAVYGARTAILFGEAPAVYAYNYHVRVVTASTVPYDMFSVVYGARTAVVFAAPPSGIYGARTAVIFNQVEMGPPIHVPQVRVDAVQSRPVPPVDQVISAERVSQATSMAIQKTDLYGFPWSYTRVPQMRELVLQARPNVVQSYDMSKQVRALAVGRFNYTIPGDVWSKEDVGQVVALVLQSIDIPYQPTSGEYVLQQTMQVLQASDPLPMWTSPAFVRQNIMLATTKRPVERLPRSNVDAALVTTQAVTKRPDEPLPYGDQYVAEVVSQAVQATEMPEPFGTIAAKQVYNLAVVPSTMPIKQGIINDAQLVTTVLQARVDAPPISRERVPQVRTLVSGATEYPSPGSMTRLEARQSRALVLQQAVYLPPDFQSYEMVPQLRVLFSTKPPASVYPDPADVYEQSRYARLPQFTELVTQRLPLALPISRTRVPQLRINAAQRTTYPSPEDMLNSGMFALQAIEHVALVADYPSTDVPASNVSVTQVTEQLVLVADYPDAHLPVNYAIIPQLSEQVAMVETYPDPGDYKSPNAVWQLTEQLTYESAYPDAGTLHSPVLALQLAQAVSLTANYPDKDAPQSYARVSQLSQQAAFKATYPNKDAPQSIARVNQVFQHVARRDLTMYQLPVPPRRHRVRIVCRFVY